MRTVWLASYPKSGNTWFRALVTSLQAEAGVDLNALTTGAHIASARQVFDDMLMLDSSVLTHEEVELLRPALHAAIAAQAAERGDDAVRFVKTHDAYSRTPAGEPLLAGSRGAAAAILIVRDPRDVVPSLANHRNGTIDGAIDFLNDPGASFCGRRDRLQNQLRQRLPGWSGFNRSWLDQRDIPVHLLRYEDMQADPQAAFTCALAFAGQPATAEGVERAVAEADFAKLRDREAIDGFREAPPQRPEGWRFFRRGEAGGWRQELTPTQVARVEAAHGELMAALGYALAQP